MSRSRKSGIQQPPPEPKRYEIVLTRAAERGLASLPKTELRRVDAKIQGLAEIPRPPGVKKLEGVDDLYRNPMWRLSYRLQIEEARPVIVIVNVGNRRDIYRLL